MPVSRDPSNSNELPPWLRGVPLPLAADADVPAPPDQALPVDDVPAWLQASAAEQPPANDEADVPAWLRASAAEQPPAEPSAEDVPAWLRDLGANDLPTPASQPRTNADYQTSMPNDAPAQSDAIPDWLRDLGPSSTPAISSAAPHSDMPAAPDMPTFAASNDVPDWLRDSGTAEPATPQRDDDWLDSFGAPGGTSTADAMRALWDEPEPAAPQAEASQPARESDDTELPAWLRADSAAAQDLSPAATTPDWLHSSFESAPDTAASAEIEEPLDPRLLPAVPPHVPDTAADDEDGVPSWLRAAPLDEVRQIMADDAAVDPHVEPFSFEGAGEDRSSAPTDDAPAWLQPADDGASTTSSWLDDIAPSRNESATSSDSPAWLDSNDTPAEWPDTAVEPLDASGDVPSWLQRDQATAPSEPASNDVPSWLRAEQASEPQDSSPSDSDVPSWLQTDQATAPSEPASNDVPSWLRAEQASEPQDSSPSDSDVPSWLQTDQAAAPSEPASNDVPSWLRAERASEPQDSSPSDSDVPSWLHADQATAPSEPASDSDVPAWLQAENTAASQDSSASNDAPSWLHADQAAAPSEPASGDVPSWLQAESIAEPLSPASDSPDTVPDWLRSEPPAAAFAAPNSDVPPWLQDDAGRPLPSAGAPGDASLPAWLQGATIDREAAAPVPVEPSAPDTSSWFDSIGDEQVEEPAAAGTENDFLSGSDLPAWLRPQQAPPTEAEQRDAAALGWLSRIGGVEEEPLAAVPVVAGPRLTPPAAPVRTQEHLNAVALLERLAAQPAMEPVLLPETAPARRSRVGGTERLLYLALLLLLVAGLLVPALIASLQVPPVATPGVQDLFARLDSLTENDVVLVGYEWNARRVSELRPLEQAVMGHLLAKKVKLVIVSTDPQGTLMAYNLRGALAQAGYQPRGADYIWLGYKPGGEVALRSLAQDMPGALRSDFHNDNANITRLARGDRTGKPLTSLQAFSAVVVLADEPLDVQGWMEQIHRSVPAIPIAFLLPAETAPTTQPYVRQSNVYAVSGIAGALTYEQLRGTDTSDAGVQYARQRLGLLVFAGLLLLGIIIGAARAAAQRRRNAA